MELPGEAPRLVALGDGSVELELELASELPGLFGLLALPREGRLEARGGSLGLLEEPLELALGAGRAGLRRDEGVVTILEPQQLDLERLRLLLERGLHVFQRLLLAVEHRPLTLRGGLLGLEGRDLCLETGLLDLEAGGAGVRSSQLVGGRGRSLRGGLGGALGVGGPALQGLEGFPGAGELARGCLGLLLGGLRPSSQPAVLGPGGLELVIAQVASRLEGRELLAPRFEPRGHL